MDEVKISMIAAAGADALALAGDTAAETMVEIIYNAMVRVAYEEASLGLRPPS